MRLCNFNIVCLAVLLPFWCTVAVEVSVQSSKPVDETPIIDNGGLDPTSHSTDPLEPTQLSVAESFPKDTKIQNVVVDGVNNKVNTTEEDETRPDEMNPKTDNGHVSLEEKGNGMMTGNEEWSIVDSKPLIAYTEEDESEDKSPEKIADVGNENPDKENGMETGNEAWFKESGSDVDESDDASTTSTMSTTVTATSPTVTNWWFDGENENESDSSTEDEETELENEDYDYDNDDMDYDYEDEDDDENIWADSKDDYKNTWEDDYDDSSYKEDEEIPIDEKDRLLKSLENDPWWKGTEDKNDWVTTTEYWETTNDLADGDYYNSESKWGEEKVIEVDAGKNMMESPHHFDNNAGVFAGAKVADESSPLESSDRLLYRWTLLLSLCLVVGLFFIFWNRHKVERYIVSWRQPSVSGHIASRRDEEKNLLHNEYA